LNIRYPQRPETHNLETSSERFFEECLPRTWSSEKPRHDYGVDLRVDIFEDNRATGLEFLVQLKSSHRAAIGETERIRLDLATYNYLAQKLQVVMFAKYVRAVNETYWILLSDIPQPEQLQQTFTIHIPKANALSRIRWASIAEHVRQVSEHKLTARQRIEDITRKLDEYLCPFCGSELTARIDAPVDPHQDDWDVKEVFECGFQRFGGIIERPCPNDPIFPLFEDYELRLSQAGKETDLKWMCFAVGKTPMARKLRLDIGYGETQDEAKNHVLLSYQSYARRRQ
jgi:hypothetical protein